MILKEIAIKTVYKHPLSRLNRNTWCVQEQYWSYLKKYDAGPFQKVVIQVDDNESLKNNDYVLDSSYSDVALVNKYFNISVFLGFDSIMKKNLLLTLLHDCMLYLAQQYNWHKEPLINAYDKCKNSHLEYRFKVKDKLFKSPSNEFVGYVDCFWDIERFTAIAKIERRDGLMIKEEKLIDVESYNGEFIYYCNCKWDDDYTLSLYSKEGQRWSIAILSVA